MRKDKKAAATAIDKAIEAAQRSVQLNDKSADAHSLLADLYGRKIGLSGGMFAGPRFGPKANEENKRAMALDEKNPRVWASTGRKYLMSPQSVWRRYIESDRVFQQVPDAGSEPRRDLGLASQSLRKTVRQGQCPRGDPARPPAKPPKPVGPRNFQVFGEMTLAHSPLIDLWGRSLFYRASP
jgi:hypothetical protein